MNSKFTQENPPKAVGGIDTLYFFADISGDNYTKIYNEMILKEKFFDGFKLMLLCFVLVLKILISKRI